MSITLSLHYWRLLPVEPAIVVKHSRVTVSEPIVVERIGFVPERRVTVSGEAADVAHAVSILTGYGARVTL